MGTVLRIPQIVWSRLSRLASLIHGYDDVRETYGDNPNDLSDAERLISRGFGSNGVNLQ